jgi:hypothetical protein
MGVIQDFNALYALLETQHGLRFFLSCQSPDANTTTFRHLQDRRTYFCCGVNSALKKCVLHNCVVVVIGTELDKRFRGGEDDFGFKGTFIIDGRHFSFPNIMMNNNVLLHNFFDKQYARDKNMRRMFLYGNFDDEKSVNRAIQLVYDRKDDVLYVRDVYAKDYIVDDGINEVLQEYLKCSGKWHDMDFVFNFDDYEGLFDQLKEIMSIDIDYQIDSLSNKIIYKHSYLLQLTYGTVINKLKSLVDVGSVRKKKSNMGILFPVESKKCYDTIVSGRLIQSVSKTLSKQKKNDQEYNSNNNNLEIFPLQHRIGNEVLRIINENLQQDMLKHTSDYVKFVDSFFHGEMTVAGKKFFLCHNVALPDINYELVSRRFRKLIDQTLFVTKNDADHNSQSFDSSKTVNVGINSNSEFLASMFKVGSPSLKIQTSLFEPDLERVEKLILRNDADPGVFKLFKRVLTDDGELDHNSVDRAPETWHTAPRDMLLVSFNNRPTKYFCRRENLVSVYYELKRGYTPVEVKIANNILFVNHHEGMVMLKKVVRIDESVSINTLQSAYEYHNPNSVVNKTAALEFVDDNTTVTTVSLMSTMVREYYRDYLHIFNTVPVAKLIVSLTNLKNGMVVQTPLRLSDRIFLPLGNSVGVDRSIFYNDRMFTLWTLIRDSRLQTAEDPYIPHQDLPIRIYHNKVSKIKGRVENTEAMMVEYRASERNNVIDVEGGNKVCVFGVLVCNAKVNWSYDGKKYKIEYCMSKNHHVYKFYMYFRRVRGQVVERVSSEMYCSEEGSVTVKLALVYSVSDLEGLKICGIHGQKGVLSRPEDLSRFKADDDSGVHAQICLSPISYLSRQTNLLGMNIKYCTLEDGKQCPLILVPYMFFNNTPDNIYKEFIGKNITGYEKLEGTRLDQWSINQSFMGNRLAEGLHCVRNGNNTLSNSGQYNIFKSLIHCNNIEIDN